LTFVCGATKVGTELLTSVVAHHFTGIAMVGRKRRGKSILFLQLLRKVISASSPKTILEAVGRPGDAKRLIWTI
jgi:hypothetical protein